MKRIKINTNCYSLLLVILLLFGQRGFANVRLPALIGDHLILQRDISIPVWGWGNPGEKISLEFNKKTYQAVTDVNGNWSVKMDRHKAGGPYKMVVKGESNNITVQDILIGDVYLCSGQSNMERGIDRTLYAEDYKISANDQIRQFKVGKQASDSVRIDIKQYTAWQAASPQTLGNFSAVAYFFANILQEKFKIPIGIINTSYSASLAEAWISREGLKDFPAFYDQPKNKSEQYNPMVLYNAMLAPLTSFAFKGVLWYQGEFNANRAYQYRTLLPALISDWRDKFKKPKLPFIIIQLPNYNKAVDVPQQSNIAELREAQAMASSIPFTALVTTIDINSNEDLHPKEKKPIGFRSALAAEKLIYGLNGIVTGPIFRSQSIQGNKIILSFDNTGRGLKVLDADHLKYFTIAGEDRKFVNASAVIINNNTVEVSSAEVANPVSVRYAWADNPQGVNFFNKEGFPTAPFRTDDWPGVTKPK